MWMQFVRAAPPDVRYWPGRRWLAAIDAVAGPGAGWVALNHVADRGGLVLPFVMALWAVSAAWRLRAALLENHRYHFTTWRWGRVLVSMLALGALLKLGLTGWRAARGGQRVCQQSEIGGSEAAPVGCEQVSGIC